MNTGTLKAKLTHCRHGKPLVCVEALTPGLSLGAEASPAQLRALAAALLQVADDADTRQMLHRGRLLPDVRKEYHRTAG